MADSDVKLERAPEEGISAVCYNSTGQYLAVSAWSSEVRVFAIEANGANCLKASFAHAQPVLDCCFGQRLQLFSGSLDKTVRAFDVASEKEDALGTHDEAVRCTAYSAAMGVLATGGWDRCVKLWDPRGPGHAGEASLEGKVFSMDTVGHSLVVAESERKITLLDVRKLSTPVASRESPLRGQTRSVRWAPDTSAYAIGSIDGRLAVEYPKRPTANYAFKCHRTSTKNDDGSSTVVVFPVNAIAFHSLYGTFATGGGDGKYCTWDGGKKKRLGQSQQFASGISSLSFNPAGTQLAVASSYSFENGESGDTQSNEVWIHSVRDREVRPKA